MQAQITSLFELASTSEAMANDRKAYEDAAFKEIGGRLNTIEVDLGINTPPRPAGG
jgi:hypothetical protein